MIAVPCWSSWKTGMFMPLAQLSLDVKHSGALMSSRLMPPRWAPGGDDVDQLVRVVLGQLDVEHVDAGELLEQAALPFHHRLGGQRADVAQAQHRGGDKTLVHVSLSFLASYCSDGVAAQTRSVDSENGPHPFDG